MPQSNILEKQYKRKYLINVNEFIMNKQMNFISKNTKSMYTFTMRKLDKYRWLRFGIVGGLGSLLHFAFLYVLTDIAGLWYMFSAVIAVLIVVTNNYMLNNIWTFQEKKVNNHLVGWLKYLSISSIADVLYLLLLAFFTEVVGIWYLLSAIISVIIVFPFRYMVSKMWVWGGFKLSRIISSKHPDDADYDWNSFLKGSPIQKWWKKSIARIVWDFIPADSYVLDVGCGSSHTLSRYKGVGLDINEEKIDFMNAQIYCDDRKYMHGDARALPFSDNSFDAVICIEVIEHMENPKEVINEIKRVAKPNAKIVLATPDYSRPLSYFIDILTPYGGYHTYRFSRKKLEEICCDCGLEALKHKYVGTCDLVELFIKTDNTVQIK